MHAAIVVLLGALVLGCASGSSTAPAASATPASEAACARQLTPRAAPRPVTSNGPAPTEAPAIAAPSRLVVQVEFPLAKLASELERKVAPRLADAKGVRLGAAGVLNYTVDRGAFSVSIADEHLVIETPVHARAEACSGRRCYASCEPRARVRAAMPVWLRSDYRFKGSRVSLDFTSGCKVRALRGLLSIDVTPLLKSALAPQLVRVQREIDRQLPDARAAVERVWRELSKARALPLGGCVVLQPLGLVQGPVQEVRRTAHARFALLAQPELRTECNERAPRVSLPPLSADPALPEEDVVMAGMELPLTGLARAFERTAQQPGSLSRFHVAEATIASMGRSVDTELTLGGEVCGTVALRAEPTFEGEEGFVTLSAGKLDPRESERVRTAGLDPAAFAAELTRLPRVPAPFSLSMLRAAVPALAPAFSDRTFAVSARVSSMRAAGAAARGESLVAWVEARGSLLLEQK
jgi:hypothetical protein